MSENKTVQTKSRLVLESRHQLIDLNKEYVNCEITFECKAADASKDFEILVINQDQLDSVDLTNLEMKKTRGGFISGVIVADEDRYQNYFLILRSGDGNPIDVDLDLKICPIPPDPAKVAAAQHQQQQQQQEYHHEMTASPAVAQHHESWIGDGKTNRTYIALAVVVVIAVVIGGVYAYKRYSSGKTTVGDALEAASSGSETGSSSSDTTRSSSVSKKDILGILHNKNKK